MIKITRLCTDFFNCSFEDFSGTRTKPNPQTGIWVFISGTENKWSLNHRDYSNDFTFKTSEIEENCIVFDFMGNPTTPNKVFESALNIAMKCKSFKLDHEDAGFFIPVESFDSVSRDIYDTERTIDSLR